MSEARIATPHGVSASFLFSVPGKIVPAVRMTQRSKYVSRQAGRYLAYKDQIGWTARQAGAQIMVGPIALRVTAFVKGRKWDASNVLKAVEDALNGICWEDDDQIVEGNIRVYDDCTEDSLTVWVGLLSVTPMRGHDGGEE